MLITTAGVLAFVSTDFRQIIRGYLLRFLLLLGAAMLMTARGYTLPDLLSTKLVDINGPFPFVVSLLAFVGAPRRNWTFIDKTMLVLSMLFSIMALIGVASLGTFTREEGVITLGDPLNMLFFPASWTALKQYPSSSWIVRVRFVPILVYSVGSLFTQTRLNFIMLFALAGVYAYLQYRRRALQAFGWIATVAFLLWASLFSFVFLRDTRVIDRVDSVAAAFSSRLDEDTRTGQLRAFFEEVPLSDLALGRGSFARWNWNGMAWGGADLGYLSLLFYGGIPLLVGYVATHVAPSLSVLRKGVDTVQLTAAGVVFLWGVRMLSSSFPDKELSYYCVVLCVGACISKESAPV